MSQRAPTECPKCGQDLTIAMRRWWEIILPMSSKWFRFICPNCGMEMVVDVDLLPTFIIRKEDGEK